MTAKTKSSVSQPLKSKSRSDGKKKKSGKEKSRTSDKSKSSQQKSVKKGLSPPECKQLQSGKPAEPSDHEIDQTQWEFSHYKDEAKGIVSEDPNNYVTDKVGESTPFLAEQKQKMLIRGEHLLNKPYFTLFFLFIEIILALTVMIAWSCFTDRNELLPIVLCYANILIIFIVLLIVFVIQFGRFNVIEEALDEDIRYRIPYEWKYWVCVLHFLRFFLTCANVTIGALDNDFDGGVIIMVSGMPIMLILSAGHVFFALRPQG